MHPKRILVITQKLQYHEQHITKGYIGCWKQRCTWPSVSCAERWLTFCFLFRLMQAGIISTLALRIISLWPGGWAWLRSHRRCPPISSPTLSSARLSVTPYLTCQPVLTYVPINQVQGPVILLNKYIHCFLDTLNVCVFNTFLHSHGHRQLPTAWETKLFILSTCLTWSADIVFWVTYW